MPNPVAIHNARVMAADARRLDVAVLLVRSWPHRQTPVADQLLHASRLAAQTWLQRTLAGG